MAEPTKDSAKELAAQVALVEEKYGQEAIQREMKSYFDHMDRIQTLNMRLVMDPEDVEAHTPLEYDTLVAEIMEATQEYYNYMGALPDEIRRLLLLAGDVSTAGDTEFDEEFTGVVEKLMDAREDKRFPGGSPLSFQSIRPRNYIMQIDAISNQLAALGAETKLKVGKRGNQPVLTTVTLDIPEHMRIEGGGMLSTYDKSLLNGVTSLLESGNTVFSVPMLYHAMTGRQNPTVDDALYEELAARLEKMRRMMISIDLTEEKEAHYITGDDGEKLEVTDVTLEGYLLPLNRVSGYINGKRTELYQILQHPPLYTYSKMRRQLASVKISLLSAPVNNNSTTIPLKTYLLQRIEMMKNQHNNIHQSNILYDSLYRELGALEASKTKKMRIRTYTTTILDYYIDQGYIKGYNEYKSGRAIAGINIML